MMQNGAIRVVLADDHPMFRFGLRLSLEGAGDIEVVGEAADGADAVTLVEELDPDVLVLDLTMPAAHGVQVIETLASSRPRVRVLVVTMSDDSASVFAAVRAGASGYVLKGAGQAELERAVRATARGEAIFGPDVALTVRERLAAPMGQALGSLPDGLSDREREVLDLLARGMSNPDIARTLYLSPKTVRNHVSNILMKLRVPDRAQAMIRAREAGLGS
jgi:DNA-binding NarL/FixJ family response regulator